MSSFFKIFAEIFKTFGLQNGDMVIVISKVRFLKKTFCGKWCMDCMSVSITVIIDYSTFLPFIPIFKKRRNT